VQDGMQANNMMANQNINSNLMEDIANLNNMNMANINSISNISSCNQNNEYVNCNECGFENGLGTFPENPVYGQSYVPIQNLDQTYKPSVGLQNGTIFPELVSPYRPGQSMAENQYIATTNNNQMQTNNSNIQTNGMQISNSVAQSNNMQRGEATI